MRYLIFVNILFHTGLCYKHFIPRRITRFLGSKHNPQYNLYKLSNKQANSLLDKWLNITKSYDFLNEYYSTNYNIINENKMNSMFCSLNELNYRLLYDNNYELILWCPFFLKKTYREKNVLILYEEKIYDKDKKDIIIHLFIQNPLWKPHKINFNELKKSLNEYFYEYEKVNNIYYDFLYYYYPVYKYD